MNWRNSHSHWGLPSQLLHWLVLGLVITQFVLAEMAEDAPGFMAKLQLLARHKSFGITILLLALLRLGWRLAQPVPRLPATMPSWQVRASQASHWLLYGLLFALPISGWLMSSAANFPVSWFGLVSLPDLVSPDKNLKEVLKTVHEILGKSLLVLAVLHSLAALKHHFLDRDDILKRMLPLPILAAATGLLLLGSSLPPVALADNSAALSTAPAPSWQIDHNASRISFTAVQAGASFTGQFTRFSGDIRFDPDNLAGSSADIQIDIRSINTENSDRDEVLASPEWFNTASHTSAQFQASQFTRLANGQFQTPGSLTLRGRSYPVTFTFKVSSSGSSRMLQGQASLDRLALGLGTGEWADTSWIGQQVAVTVTVQAQVAAPTAP